MIASIHGKPVLPSLHLSRALGSCSHGNGKQTQLSHILSSVGFLLAITKKNSLHNNPFWIPIQCDASLTFELVLVNSWKIRRGDMHPNRRYGLILVDLGNGDQSSLLDILQSDSVNSLIIACRRFKASVSPPLQISNPFSSSKSKPSSSKVGIS